MFRAIAEVFNELLTQTSVSGAIVAFAALMAIAILAYYAKLSIDLKKKESEKRLEIMDRKSEIMDRESKEKDSQHRALIEEVRQSRVQMIDHMNRDRREKDRLTRTLGSMVAEIRAQTKVMDSLRLFVEKQYENVSKKFDEVKDMIRGN